jgi:tetratricopeptide (TPR) repeat protein
MSDKTLRDTPYKGLVPYDEEDDQFFFGREAETEIITANLMASRLTLLYGPSGVGKSSVLRAGVAAGLRQEENVTTKGTPRFVLVIFNEWKDDPLAGLLNQVEQTIRGYFPGEQFEPISPELSFADTLSVWAERVGGKLLIVLDQFEDYFLYPQKGTFAFEFPDAINRPDLRANFLISIREDWVAKLDQFKDDLPNLFDNYLRIDGLEREAAETAIEQPVLMYNKFRKPDEPEVIIVGKFADKVLDQLGALANKIVLGESGSGQVKGDGESEALKTTIQPPYLQLVMIHLWQKAVESSPYQLHPRMLEDPDAAEKIIQSHLEDVMKRLDDTEREVASLVFDHLVTPSGRKIAQSLGDLAHYTKLPESQIRSMLDKLSSKENGILSKLASVGSAGETSYEIFHDVLGPAVLLWRRRYVNEKEVHEANLRAEQEKQKAKEQTRIAARLRRLSAALAVITGLAIILGLAGIYLFYVTWTQRILIASAQKEIEESKGVAEKAIAQSKQDRSDADKAIARSTSARTEADKAIAQSLIDRNEADAAIAKSVAAQKLLEVEKAQAEEIKMEATLYAKITDLYQQALALYRANDLKGAMGKYLELNELFKQTGDLTQQADALSQAAATSASIAYDPEAATEAVKYYTDAKSLYQRSGNVKEEAATLMALGPIYLGTNSGQEAFDSYVQAAVLYERLGETTKLDEAITAAEDSGQFAYVTPAITKQLDGRLSLLRIFQRNPKKYQLNEIATRKHIGEIYFASEQKEKSLENFQKVLEMDGNDVDTLKIIGDLYYQLNKKEEALRYYEKALPFFNDPPRQKGEPAHVVILASIGDIYRQLKNKEKALENYSQLQELNQKCLALKKTGDMYKELNDKELALNTYLQLDSIAKEDSYCFYLINLDEEFSGPVGIFGASSSPTMQGEVDVLNSIAAIYKELGDNLKFVEYSQRAQKRKENPFE